MMTTKQPETRQIDSLVRSDALFSLVGELSKRLVWIAPVGNYVGGACSAEKGHFKMEIRGYMVCHRFVNNVDGPNTAVTFLRNDGKGWKKPFTEGRGMFPSMESAIIAAAKHEGIWENAEVKS
ncbi:MAG: hypothetical protein AAF357_00345 [Verrucomicrobiota bacterium]